MQVIKTRRVLSKEIPNLEERVRYLVRAELRRARDIWGEVERDLVAKNDSAVFAESIETPIPGYPTIDPVIPEVGEFIAFVVDMRDSTDHLTTSIHAKATCFQRVFYETSALLPAVAEVVSEYDGNVTEYLGDGALALFKTTDDENDPSLEARNEACRQVSRAARFVLGDMRGIINDELDTQFDLPPLSLGVGMAYSRAVVTVVGSPEQRMPKAIGQCVYRASKLATLINEVAIDKDLRTVWPKQSGGKMTFNPRQMKGVTFDAFVIGRSSE